MKTEDIIKMGQAFQMVQEKKKKMDPVDKDELDGTHADRDDKDIDNDGDADSTDKYLHKRRKAITKATDEMSSKEKMKKGLYNSKNNPVKEGDAKSADKKPEDYIDPNDGKKKVRMVPVDKQIVDKDKEMKKESTGFDIYDRIQEKAKEEEPAENKKMALQKALQKSAAPSEKGKKAVTLPKAPFDIPKTKEQKESNQELEMHTDYARPNSVNSMREAMQQMWQEAADREAHYKGATKPDGMKDNRKGKGAQDMMDPADTAAADPDKTVEKGMDDVAKAGRAGPSMKARRNDNMKGDKNIINKIGRTT